MLIPREVFEQSAEDLREIVWWNQSLTKLSQHADTTGLEQMLVETDGPYIEKVTPPAYYPIEDPLPWHELADRLEISEEVKNAVTKVLFKGETKLPLFFHQGEALSYLCTDIEIEKNVVLSVPTATGKTEAFMVPILDYCVKKRKEKELFEQSKHLYDLKALIIYPIKSLEVDQLNRFIEYLYQINKELEEKGHYPVRIGIWDGDTPTGVANIGSAYGEDFDSYGQYVQREDSARGLKCPKHDDVSLQYFDDTTVLCQKGHTLKWVSMTREGIRNGVDILITNPEALSHLLISPKNVKIIVSEDLKYIVIDEAHTWKGVSGSIFSIFLQRLRALFKKSAPNFILSSATIQDPVGFGNRLLHTSNVKLIGYQTLMDSINIEAFVRKINFSRIPHSRFDYSMFVLLGLDRISSNTDALTDFLITQNYIPEPALVKGSFSMLSALKLIEIKAKSNIITDKGLELLSFFNLESDIDGDLDSIISKVFDSLPLMKKWTEIICDVDEGLPEIMYLSDRIFGKNNFMKEIDVLNSIKTLDPAIDTKRAYEILSTLLSFGRVSRTIFDKYHFFQKPITKLYVCLECNRVYPIPECPNDKSHGEMSELYFCTKCHTPAYPDEKGDLVLLNNQRTDGRCSCDGSINMRSFRTVFMPYSVFTTFLMSVIADKIDPKKILVFGDGRQLVESIANRTQNLDYSLVAQRIIAYQLLTNGPTTLPDIYESTGKLLEDIYIDRTPIKVLSESYYSLPSNIVENLHSLRSSFIRKIKYELPTPSRRWFESAIISFSHIHKYSDPLEKAFVHSILSEMLTYQFYSNGRIKVGAEWLNVVLTKQLKRRLERYLGYADFFESNRFEEILVEIVQATNGLELTDVIRSGNDERRLDSQALVLRRDDSDLSMFVPQAVGYCENCYVGYPTTELSQCPFCLSELNKGQRFTLENGKISGDGYLLNTRDSRWSLDHWAKDILGYSVNWYKEYPDPVRDWDDLVTKKMEYMVVLSHRSGIAQKIRSEIEEGFKRKVPTVHAVCATPTMELGIDIGTLNHICQIGIPPTKTNYVQRAGRTGRKMRVPSLIFTIIRNENEIDSYFLTDLSSKFLNRDLNPIFIPTPSEVMLLNHVFLEIFQYLNIHQFETRSQYNRYYEIFPFSSSIRNSLATEPVEKIFNYVLQSSYYPLAQDILRNYKEIIIHLRKVFKPFDIDVEEFLNELLYGSSSRLIQNTLEVFEKLEELYSKTLNDKAKKEFIERNSVLGMFLGTLNMFTEFRGIGSSVPIYDARDGGIIELKSSSYALRESFPGEYKDNRPRRGALWFLETRRFDIIRVIGKYPSLIPSEQSYMICDNSDCDNPFETYPSTMERCPWCDEALEELDVYEFQYGEARPASSGVTSRISTQPIKKTLILSDDVRSGFP